MAYRLLSRTRAARLLGLAITLLASGCDNGNGDRAPGAEREVELHFDVKVGSERVACGQALPGLGMTSARARSMTCASSCTTCS